MRVTRLGHSCLVIEEGGVTILTDPGMWNETPRVSGIAAILITHEHQDHFDIEQVRAVLAQNPNAKVITHKSVGAKLDEAGIAYTPIASGESVDVSGVSIESYGTDHAIIYGDTSPCQNTGYLIAGRLFMPGDALHDVPPKAVEILALPTGGPWMKMSMAIDYVKNVKPKIVFPIHDAMYNEDFRKNFIPRFVANFMPGVAFENLLPGESKEF